MSDERQAEAMYVIVMALLLLALLLMQYLAWALLGPTMQDNPVGSTALIFWGGQVIALVLGVLLGIVGFKPAITATIGPDGLHMQQGKRACTLLYDEMKTAKPLSPLLFHRHYARYAVTQSFISQMPATLLLITTSHGPVVIGLRPEDHLSLLYHLRAELTPTFDLAPARVA